MKLDNLCDTNIFIDLKSFTQIKISSTKNNRGILEIDEFENSLVSDIDSGSTPLGVLSKYPRDGKLLLHNQVTGGFALYAEGDTIDMECDFIRGIRYYTESEVVVSSKRVGNRFDVDLKGKKIFKIFACGLEVKGYIVGDNYITLSNVPIGILNTFDELVIYLYGNDSIAEEDVDEIEITYMQYNKTDVWFGSTEDNYAPYLYEGNLLEINNTESVALNISTSTSEIAKPLKKGVKYVINDVKSSVSINTYISDLEPLISKYVGTNQFRIILSNPILGRGLIINNCHLDGSESIVMDKGVSSINLNIPCGNYIDMQIMEDSAYGLDEYGVGYFGKKASIKNSNRG